MWGWAEVNERVRPEMEGFVGIEEEVGKRVRVKQGKVDVEGVLREVNKRERIVEMAGGTWVVDLSETDLVFCAEKVRRGNREVLDEDGEKVTVLWHGGVEAYWELA